MQFAETDFMNLLQQIGSWLDITYAFIENSLSGNYEKQIPVLVLSVVAVAYLAGGTAWDSQQ